MTLDNLIKKEKDEHQVKRSIDYAIQRTLTNVPTKINRMDAFAMIYSDLKENPRTQRTLLEVKELVISGLKYHVQGLAMVVTGLLIPFVGGYLYKSEALSEQTAYVLIAGGMAVAFTGLYNMWQGEKRDSEACDQILSVMHLLKPETKDRLFYT